MLPIHIFFYLSPLLFSFLFFFFFNDTATTEIYTLSLHDALPISAVARSFLPLSGGSPPSVPAFPRRSEEHTSELQSRSDLVCRLLLEKKKKRIMIVSPSVSVSLHCWLVFVVRA